MKVKKNINNNISLCLDDSGKEVVIFGKGVGFIKPPSDVPLSRIERTFYHITQVDFQVIKSIPSEIINASIKIVNHAEERLGVTLMSTTILSLADHINFAIQRKNDFINLNLPLQEDLKSMYPNELNEGLKALEIINDETGVRLDHTECVPLALYFINNNLETDASENQLVKYSEEIRTESISIIENIYDLSLDKTTFNFSRFLTHVDYLLRRALKGKQISSSNNLMYESLKNNYPLSYQCVLEFGLFLKRNYQIILSDEEKVYLMIHINRLWSRVKEGDESQ